MIKESLTKYESFAVGQTRCCSDSYPRKFGSFTYQFSLWDREIEKRYWGCTAHVVSSLHIVLHTKLF